jgi:hypothetical protein
VGTHECEREWRIACGVRGDNWSKGRFRSRWSNWSTRGKDNAEARSTLRSAEVWGRIGRHSDMRPVTQIWVCATGFFVQGLRFLGGVFGGVGFHGGSGFGHGGDHCFGVPEIHGDFGDFFGRIA